MDEYRHFATVLAKKAGNIIKNGFLSDIKTEWKGDNTPVTQIDKEINSLVMKTIKDKYPEHSILAEEESDLSKSDYVWVCDPLDGTIPFSVGYPCSVFTLALIYKGEVILGIIYDPYMERFVIAEKGKGAFLNGKQIFVSERKSIKSNYFNIESHSSFIADLTPLYHEIILRDGIPMMIRSVVYAGMLLAMGQISGIYYGAKFPWDAAANKIIIEEAGGKVTDLYGNDQRYDQDTKGFIASNGLLHEELVEIVKSVVKL